MPIKTIQIAIVSRGSITSSVARDAVASGAANRWNIHAINNSGVLVGSREVTI